MCSSEENHKVISRRGTECSVFSASACCVRPSHSEGLVEPLEQERDDSRLHSLCTCCNCKVQTFILGFCLSRAESIEFHFKKSYSNFMDFAASVPDFSLSFLVFKISIRTSICDPIQYDALSKDQPDRTLENFKNN